MQEPIEPETLPSPTSEHVADLEQARDAIDTQADAEPGAPTPEPPPPPPSTPSAEIEVEASERSPEDLARAQIVADDLKRRGIDCTVDDVLFGHALVGHVRALLRVDPGARNKASSRLADYASPLGMTSAVLLAKMARELRAAQSEPEQVAIVAVASVTVIGALLHSQLPKWGGRGKVKGRS